jgi:hypothetical protein
MIKNEKFTFKDGTEKKIIPIIAINPQIKLHIQSVYNDIRSFLALSSTSITRFPSF